MVLLIQLSDATDVTAAFPEEVYCVGSSIGRFPPNKSYLIYELA